MGEIHNKKELEVVRKELRNHGTSAEATLWNHLKNKQLDGRKFRRQHSISNCTVDFFCPAESLVVEVDGEPHYNIEGYEKDQRRTLFLEGLKMKVIRFENCEVFDNIDAVLAKIRTGFTRGR